MSNKDSHMGRAARNWCKREGAEWIVHYVGHATPTYRRRRKKRRRGEDEGQGKEKGSKNGASRSSSNKKETGNETKGTSSRTVPIRCTTTAGSTAHGVRASPRRGKNERDGRRGGACNAAVPGREVPIPSPTK